MAHMIEEFTKIVEVKVKLLQMLVNCLITSENRKNKKIPKKKPL